MTRKLDSSTPYTSRRAWCLIRLPNIAIDYLASLLCAPRPRRKSRPSPLLGWPESLRLPLPQVVHLEEGRQRMLAKWAEPPGPTYPGRPPRDLFREMREAARGTAAVAQAAGSDAAAGPAAPLSTAAATAAVGGPSPLQAAASGFGQSAAVSAGQPAPSLAQGRQRRHQQYLSCCKG